MWRSVVLGIALSAFFGLTATAGAQEPAKESLGDSVSRGVREIEAKLRETWADVQRGTQRMTVQGRVYARLYWDKSLVGATIDIESRDGGIVVLKGSVPNISAQQRAADLVESTVGVKQAVNELAIAPTGS
jgi:osmotically-inducible protein OsmY